MHIVFTKHTEFRPVARLFCGGGGGGGGKSVKFLGPFMITGGLSCDRVEFGHFGQGGGGGSDDPPLTPPPATGLELHNFLQHRYILNSLSMHYLCTFLTT